MSPIVSSLDSFQDFLVSEHMEPRMHLLEISISSLNHVIVRPTKTPKLADKNCAQYFAIFYMSHSFLVKSLQKTCFYVHEKL